MGENQLWLDRVFRNRHEELVDHALSRLRLPTREIAEDLVQDFYCHLPGIWARLSASCYEEARKIAFGVVKNMVHNFNRQSRRDPARSNPTPLKPSPIDPASEIVAAIDSEWVLGLLSDVDAEVLKMRFLDELPPREIAQRLEISSGNARVRVHRALAKARELTKDHSAE